MPSGWRVAAPAVTNQSCSPGCLDSSSGRACELIRDDNAQRLLMVAQRLELRPVPRLEVHAAGQLPNRLNSFVSDRSRFLDKIVVDGLKGEPILVVISKLSDQFSFRIGQDTLEGIHQGPHLPLHLPPMSMPLLNR